MRDKAPAFEPLAEQRTIGGYALLFDPHKKTGDYSKYCKASRAIQIMTDRDDRETIDLKTAMLATGRWNPHTGEMIGMHDTEFLRYKSDGWNEGDKTDTYATLNHFRFSADGAQVPL